MKKYFIFLILLVSTKLTSAQNWQWAKHIGSDCPPQNERINSVITDGSNIYVLGAYFGCLYLQNDTLISNGLNDGFIVKYDANGNEVWAKTLGGSYNQIGSQEETYGVFDPINNCIYVAGSFINSISFGGTLNLNSSHLNDEDIFVARMDLNGNFIWAKKGGSFGPDRTYIFAQPNGDVFLAGRFNNPGLIDTDSVLSGGGFFARFDSNGNFKWASHKFSGPDSYEINISFIDSDIIIGGTFNIGTVYLDTANLVSNGSYDGFVSRMDSIGNVIWIKTFGGVGGDGVSGITLDNSKNIYLTGGFQDSINLAGIPVVNNGKDILIAKLDENGNAIWARNTFANGSNEGGIDINSDSDGNCYVVGIFSGSATFGAFNISTTNIYDMFLTRYNNSGDCLGVRHFGQATGSKIAVDNSGNAICGGTFQNIISIGGNSFTSYAGYDIYLAKIDAITGIGEGDGKVKNNQLLIYANPNAGKCNITVPDDFLHEKYLTLSILDNTGKLIQQKTLEMNEGKIKVNLEQEAKGVYNVMLSSKKKSYSGRIVFE